ncbi:MAG TPA: type II toxin-antitoxin system Phd/YefM family antitoxin [Rubrivivax sp.]|nr:type II toxin-antitoxin system Phd/YefM family antitoxin [Rubrivivax sp.]
MHGWSEKEARSRFGEMLDDCIARGPQFITRRGVGCAVLLSIDEWHRLLPPAQPSLKQLLLANGARWNLDPPASGRLRRRIPAAPR